MGFHFSTTCYGCRDNAIQGTVNVKRRNHVQLVLARGLCDGGAKHSLPKTFGRSLISYG